MTPWERLRPPTATPPPTAHARRDQSLRRRENCNGRRRGRLPGRFIAIKRKLRTD